LNKLIPLLATGATVLITGWANLHTDEPTVVLAFAVSSICLVGFRWQKLSMLAGVLISASIPLSQQLALWFGFSTPYPNSQGAIRESCIVFLLLLPIAVAVFVIGSALRKSVNGTAG